MRKMHHVIHCKPRENRDEDALSASKLPANHGHEPDHRQQGAKDGEGGKEGDEHISRAHEQHS